MVEDLVITDKTKCQNILLKFQASLPPSSDRMCQGAPAPVHSRPPLPPSSWFTLGGVSHDSLRLSQSSCGGSPGTGWLSPPLDSRPFPAAPLDAHSMIPFPCVLYCLHCLFFFFLVEIKFELRIYHQTNCQDLNVNVFKGSGTVLDCSDTLRKLMA